RLGAPPDERLARRLAPFAAVAALWTVVTPWVRSRGPNTAPLHFGLDSFAAGYAHGIQTLLGIEHPPAFVHGLAHPGAPSLALPLFALLALALRPSPGAPRVAP